MQYERLWIVVPFYQGHESITPLLEGLHSAFEKGLNAVIVDNSPNSSTEDESEFWFGLLARYAQLVVLRSAPGIGFGRACNLGALFAFEHGASHFVLLNQDAVLHAESLDTLWEQASLRPSALFAPVEVIPGTRRIHPRYAEWYLSGLLPDGDELSIEMLPSGPQRRTNLGGMCLLIPSTVLMSTGLFDPLYTMYGEDGEFCRRAVASGFELYLVPDAALEHEHSNLNASNERRARIVVWIREGRALERLRDGRRSLVADVARVILRRTVERGYDLLVARDFTRIPLSFQSDARLVKRFKDTVRARNGESTSTRMRRYAAFDRSLSELIREKTVN